MEKFILKPCDILVCETTKPNMIDDIEIWALGNPFTHAMLYYADGLIYQSIPSRGCILNSIAAEFGRYVVVVRPQLTGLQVNQVRSNMVNIVEDVRSHYDFVAIPQYVIPRLVIMKLGLGRFLPLRYHQHPSVICSMAVAEAFWRSGIDNLLPWTPDTPDEPITLPGDFVTYNPKLIAWQGIISEEVT